MNQPSSPRWTTLPPFPLRGQGTVLVESLRHYSNRVEASSGLRRRAILDQLSQTGDRSYFGFFGGSPLVTVGRLAAHLELLSGLTGNPGLAAGTFLALQHVMKDPTSQKWIRWCPECLSDGSVEDWHPILWTIPLLKTCPLHGCDIRDRCASCGSQRAGYCSHAKIHLCGKCGLTLAGRGLRTTQSSSDTWADRQIVSLVTHYCSAEAVIIPAALRADMIQALERRYSFSGGKKSYLQSASTIVFPTLETMLSIAAAQAVSLLDLIARPEASLAQDTIDGCGIQYLHFHPSPETYRARSLSMLLARLTSVEDITYLPPLSRVLSVLGLSRAQAMNLRRDECRRYESLRRRDNSSSMLGHLDRAFMAGMHALDPGGVLGRRVRKNRQIALHLSLTECIPFERAHCLVLALRVFRNASFKIIRERFVHEGMKFRVASQQKSAILPGRPRKSEDHARPQQGTLWDLDKAPSIDPRGPLSTDPARSCCDRD